MIRKRFAGVAAIFLAFPVAGASADQTGIAFAYAPEQSLGVCTGGSPDKAFACARKKCVEGGAEERDCARVAWCFPSGWSAVISVMHKEGIHWSEFLCGWETRQAAEAAARLRCETKDKTFIADCALGVLYDPDGKEISAN